jgi:hypothetical protein
MHMTEHGERGAQADVLSTQSTREPDVVNGIRESIRSGS